MTASHRLSISSISSPGAPCMWLGFFRSNTSATPVCSSISCANTSNIGLELA